MHIYRRPDATPTRVWVLNVKLLGNRSTAGKTFAEMAIPHGDNHDLWIDPRDPQRMIEGNDGGATISFNGGETWTTIYNQPTGEFYHVITDNQIPYRVYGAQQDNTAITVPSRSLHGAITRADWYELGGGESGYIAIRPDNPNIVYGAAATAGLPDRATTIATGQVRNITVWPKVIGGRGGERSQVPLPVDLPDRALAARSQYAVCHRQPRLPLARTRARVGKSSVPT